MRMVGIELKALIKTTLLHIVVYSVFIIATLVAVRIINADGSFATKIQESVTALPQTLQTIFSFVTEDSISVEMKIFLTLISVLYLPILYYASKIVLCSLEKEEDSGTISFLYNDAKSRKTIIISKYIAGVINYLCVILFLFGISTLLIANSYSKSEAKQLAASQLFSIWGGLLVIGILLTTIGTVYATLKRKESSGASFAFGLLMWTVLIGLIPYFMQFIAAIMEKAGKNVDALSRIIERLGVMKYGSLLYWGNPIEAYQHPIGMLATGVILVTTVLLIVAAIVLYNRREFGE